MPLPSNLNVHPTSTVIVPSTKNKLKIRPYTVKEEKILLAAKASNTDEDMLNAVDQILTNCIVSGEYDVAKAPLFDNEYLFLKLHIVSVNNISEFDYFDPEDNNKKYEMTVDLNDVEVKFPEGHTNTIALSDDVGVIMKYPNSETMMVIRKQLDAISENINIEQAVDILFQIYSRSIEKIYDENGVYVYGVDFNDEDAVDFLNNISVKNLEKIQEFFQTMPILSHTISYKNSQGEIKSFELSGLSDFFIF